MAAEKPGKVHAILSMDRESIACQCGSWRYLLPTPGAWGRMSAFDHLLDMHARHAEDAGGRRTDQD